MKNIIERIKRERLYFDGGTGTVLQKLGLMSGEAPEIMNQRAPDEVKALHMQYIACGADIIKTNTFGINSLKYNDVYKQLSLALGIAREAVALSGKDTYIAFDVGPTGRMLKPYGDLGFEEAVAVFAENMKYAEELGADLILIETMSDIYEIKAAVLAAKENSSLPIFVSCAFGSDGKLLTGADPLAVIAMLEGMGVSAIGMNCSFGPRGMRGVLESFLMNSSLPVIVNPNAGLPKVINGETVYDLDAEEFAELVREICLDGNAVLLGGCCGTTPKHIAKLRERTQDIPYSYPSQKETTVVSSYTHGVCIGDVPKIVGERINPTGKPKLKEALRNSDVSYILSIALEEEKCGAHILDVNVGVPGIDEKSTIQKIVSEIQAVCDLPLQIDTGSYEAMEAAMRIYSGKPLVNSVNGGAESMQKVFPLVKKYGGTVIALTMDENGIPETAEGRVAIAKRIAEKASEYGIAKKDIIFDPLVLTVASGSDNAVITLSAMKKLKAFGYKCSLGISNVSFGLPGRDILNTSFYTTALHEGLDLAIINPSSESMMRAYFAALALDGVDTGCAKYIASVTCEATVTKEKNSVKTDTSLGFAIQKGLKKEAEDITAHLLCDKGGLEIIEDEIIPALSAVGDDFEAGRVYLPGLLMSAEAATSAFSVIRERLPMLTSDTSGKIVLATVKGDIHDIGKNIVKLIFESYGYKVIDLGRDVDKCTVIDALRQNPDALLGLSALMTTTLGAMEETVREVKTLMPDVKIIVGGAVLTEDYAAKISADFYAPNALSAVKYAESLVK